MKGGQSKEVGSRESQREGVEERREARARDGWRCGVWEERRFFLTTSRWPRAVKRDWGGLRRISFVVSPRMVMYPRRIALRRVVLEGEPRERETYVAKAASLRLEIGGVVGLMERAEIVKVCRERARAQRRRHLVESPLDRRLSLYRVSMAE
jgi:hypothetical protein